MSNTHKKHKCFVISFSFPTLLFCADLLWLLLKCKIKIVQSPMHSIKTLIIKCHMFCTSDRRTHNTCCYHLNNVRQWKNILV